MSRAARYRLAFVIATGGRAGPFLADDLKPK
jgi:hypothetical protein